MRRCVEEGLRIESKPGKARTAFEWYLAWVHYLSGQPERAERTMREALRGTKGTDDPVSFEWHAFNYSVLAHIAADAGRWDEAAESQAEAERLRPRMGLDEARHWGGWLTTLLPHLRLMSHRGDPETFAFAYAIDDFMKDMSYNPPSLLLMSRVMLGEVALEQGELASARGWCDSALKVLAEWPDAGMLGRRARALKDALERRVMAEPITPAEQRVLELLPTRLTVAHLAERLFLSPATVKAHLRAVYRKLEVGTREEAVERARELGLLKR
jgi:LuxR family maltose regulon positive regulatory protein